MPSEIEEIHRRSIRLRSWDYRERGAYFVTICTHKRRLLFTESRWREVAETVWQKVARSGGDPPDAFVVMPNHVHGIIWRPGTKAVGAQQPNRREAGQHLDSRYRSPARPSVAAPLRGRDTRFSVDPGSLGAIVRAFKAATARRINNLRNTPGDPAWQRNYYERVIRDERELNDVREYILDNPRRWHEDKYNPTRIDLRIERSGHRSP